jgi:4-hydroxythreonine-4-phosphate dehydrogenase
MTGDSLLNVPKRRPSLVALTLGDVAGVGPELVVRAWRDPRFWAACRPIVIGDSAVLRRALPLTTPGLTIQPIDGPEQAEPSLSRIDCLDAASVDLSDIVPGRIDARAGRAAYDFLTRGIDLARSGRIDAIVTLPLQKEALHAGGIKHPGHTEILAEKCGVRDFAMMLYLPPGRGGGTAGLGVVHATLHVALRQVFDLLTRDRVLASIRLADSAFRPLLQGAAPRIAVAGLNPHAGEGGLFGDEESTIIRPAVEAARDDGLDVTGPIAADTLFAKAIAGGFDAVVAMYHDQGHCAIKTVGFDHAVNVTIGLPIVRTSVAHGTAFDIAWRGLASPESLIAAVQAAGVFSHSREPRTREPRKE